MTEIQEGNKLDKDQLTLKPTELALRWKILFKLLAFLALFWALLVMATETTLIFSPEDTLINFLVNFDHNQTVMIFLLSVGFMSGITLNCYFTIFNMEISDFFQMRQHQTTCIEMSAITGVCAKIINVICYNFMVICGEINKDWEQQQFHTSFVEFYGSMIKTPFFGDYYNVLAPLMILILSITFAVLGLFKYNSKNMEAIVLFNQKRENTSDNKKSRVDKQF